MIKFINWFIRPLGYVCVGKERLSQFQEEGCNWYVKDFADGWIEFNDVTDALHEAIETGAIMVHSFGYPASHYNKHV